MAINVQQRGKRHQLRVIDKLLPKPFFFTFDTESEARAYGEQLQALLARGIVPQELLVAAPRGHDPLLVEIIRAYTKAAPLTDSDDALLTTMLPELAGRRASGVTFAWAEQYIRDLKAKRLAPSSIRKRVGVLGRVMDWHIRQTTKPGEHPLANVLRLLPKGYSVYTRAEAEQLQAAKVEVPRDVERDRRLHVDEERRIVAALAGQKREGRERALEVDPQLTMLYHLVVDTGLRLREAYRLRVDQVDLARHVIRVEGSKGHRGESKPRVVPIKPQLEVRLREYLRGRVGLLFGFWDGRSDPKSLKACTARLSSRFATLFAYAQVDDFTEHDLRHEATCRWVEMRSSRGGWVFSEIEICRIMGWKDTRMMLRYASLRGEDLAARML